jgi:hypothetical protein
MYVSACFVNAVSEVGEAANTVMPIVATSNIVTTIPAKTFFMGIYLLP